MNVITMFPVIASEQSDRSNLMNYRSEHEIAASTLKNDVFLMSPRNDGDLMNLFSLRFSQGFLFFLKISFVCVPGISLFPSFTQKILSCPYRTRRSAIRAG